MSGLNTALTETGDCMPGHDMPNRQYFLAASQSLKMVCLYSWARKVRVSKSTHPGVLMITSHAATAIATDREGKGRYFRRACVPTLSLS